MRRVPTCHRTFLTFFVAPLLGLAALASPAAHAEAATVAVRDCNGGSGSLRSAITNAVGDDTMDMSVGEAAPVGSRLVDRQDNSGPTPTPVLMVGSPATDRGSNPLRRAHDQRGPGFPRLRGALADIDAYER